MLIRLSEGYFLPSLSKKAVNLLFVGTELEYTRGFESNHGLSNERNTEPDAVTPYPFYHSLLIWFLIKKLEYMPSVCINL
ncbi:hypothetical protein HZS_1334 [Henneguya salminicola]|nr:hypothetical protein HZS_1334 [Henneguya salminicola]